MDDYPRYSQAERLARDTFRALMSALSFPGRVFHLPLGDVSTITSFATIGETLLDLETTYYTPDDDMDTYLGRTGARAAPANQAAYHFYPLVDSMTMSSITAAAMGTMLYPDQSATFFVGCKLRARVTLQLTGPGIPMSDQLQVNQLPRDFWTVRKQAIDHYPLGWDVILVDGRDIVGLPRTTQIEVQEAS
jgi:alpha-D-ribose 1-methylphosphonate 5-triphosphate synthase subunit PhnH